MTKEPGLYKDIAGNGSVDVYAHYKKKVLYFVFSVGDSVLLVAEKKINSRLRPLRHNAPDFPSLYRKKHATSSVNTGKFFLTYQFQQEVLKYNSRIDQMLNKFYRLEHSPFRSIDISGGVLTGFLGALKEDGLYDFFNDLDLVKGLISMENKEAIGPDVVAKIRAKFEMVYI